MTLGHLIGFLAALFGIMFWLIPTIQWFETPELTAMQIFLQNWVLYTIGVSLMGTARFLLKICE